MVKMLVPGGVALTESDRKLLEFRGVIRHGGNPSARSPFTFTICPRCGCSWATPLPDGGVKCTHCGTTPDA